MTTIELYHEKHGSPGRRTPLLLVHGGAGTIGTNWTHAIPTFADDRLVIGVELQGHGHTPHSSRPYTFDNSADDLARLVADLGLDSVDVMGFSNGGPTVLRFASRHAGRTRRIVVASGFARRDGMIDGFWTNFDAPDINDMPSELAEAYRAINPDPADLWRMFELDVALMRGFEDFDDAELSAMQAPALFVGGDRDVVRPEHTVWMAQATPHGRPLVLPAGHGDYLGAVDAGELDAPLAQASLTLIKRFLDEND
ncbi:alpha/beta fold hydrolase [Gordonia sp. CPCC 205515]|uniref:alpha/beta fold hydrolase n=1 Tax=Gordonia sp. CPCC 205515 TaxID=3140791 RepID=UPI003AF39DF1